MPIWAEADAFHDEMRCPVNPWTSRHAVRGLLAAALLTAACSGGDGPPTGTQGGSITISVSTGSVTVNQGASATVTVTVSRAGGFSGAVTVAVQNAPTGVTAAGATIGAGSASASLTIQASGTAPAGTSTLTIRASGAGVSDATATLSLIVAAIQTGGFTLSLSPATATVQQGTNTQVTVNITRTAPFTGAVALSATGLPSGVTAAFNPTSATGNSAALTLTAAANAATGTQTITVRGTGTGVSDQSVTLAVTVNAASAGGNATWRACPGQQAPIWFAVQDGNGPWTRINPVNNTYTFTINSARGGVALVAPDGGAGGFVLTIFYFSASEITSTGDNRCANALGSKTINGTVAGVGQGEQANIAYGGAFSAVIAPATAFTLQNVPDAAADLIASRNRFTIVGQSVTNTVLKLILRRNLNLANNSNLPVLDFGAAEAFDPVTRNAIINNLGADQAFLGAWYTTTNGFVNSFFASGGGSNATTQPWQGIPTDRQVATDLHALQVSAVPAGGAPSTIRSMVQYFRVAADRTFNLGANLNVPTVTVAATAPYVRFRIQLAVQTEYDLSWGASFSQGAGAQARAVSISVSAGYTGTITNLDITMPDLTGAAGWTNTWGPVPGLLTQWTVGATDWVGTPPGAQITEGTTIHSATRLGSITP